MSEIKIISTGKDIAAYLENLRSRNITKIALDLEGDQGSINYNYSISIFQCYDGFTPVVIDVLKTASSKELKEFLTSRDIIKVMFSSENDLFMTQNVLGYSIETIRDIAIAQKLLGMKINLSDYIGIEKNIKDSYQRANWLRRPIKTDLLEYAVNDVLYLLEINNKMEVELIEKNLFDKYIESSARVSEKNFIVNQFKQYTEKFPGYKRLTREKKELGRTIWIFRELVGEYFNCPSGYVFSKKTMNDIISDKDNILIKLEQELNRNRGGKKKIDMEFIKNFYQKAEIQGSRHEKI
jgi:ribonuclease D